MPRNSNRSRNYTYTPVSSAVLKEKATEPSGDFIPMFLNDLKTYKIKSQNNIRIIPCTWEDGGFWGVDLYSNFQIGSENMRLVSRLKMLPDGENDDPIRELALALEEEGATHAAKKLKPSKQIAMYIVDNDDLDAGVQVFVCPVGLSRDITLAAVDKRTGEPLNIDDPVDGYDVYFDRKGKGKTCKYVGVQVARQPSELDEEFLEFAIDNPLPDAINILEYDTIVEILGKWAPTNTSEDSEDAAPTRRNKIGNSSGRRNSARSRSGGSRGVQRDDSLDEDNVSNDVDYTPDEILDMSGDELCDLCDEEQLTIDTGILDDDNLSETEALDALAHGIIDELGLSTRKPSRGVSRNGRMEQDESLDDEDSPDDESPRSRRSTRGHSDRRRAPVSGRDSNTSSRSSRGATRGSSRGGASRRAPSTEDTSRRTTRRIRR